MSGAKDRSRQTDVPLAAESRARSNSRQVRAAEAGRGLSSDVSVDSPDQLHEKTDITPRKISHDHLNNRLFFRLFQIGNQLERQSIQQLGISTVQWAVLGALSRDSVAAGMPFGGLSEYLAVTRQNLDGVLKRLERDGLVRRVTDDGDKRARIVQLTPQGRTFWVEILQRIYQFYDQAASRFSFDGRVAFVHYLNELQKDLVKVELPKAGMPKRNGG